LQTVKIGQLTQQCILTLIVETAVPAQDADCARQRLDRCCRLSGHDQRIREADQRFDQRAVRRSVLLLGIVHGARVAVPR